MEQLPDHVLLEIFTYLTLPEVIRLERLSRSMLEIFKTCPMNLFNYLRTVYQSPFFPVDYYPLYSGLKRMCMKLHTAKELQLEMLAFYTDGGLLKANPYDSMLSVFSTDFFNSCYSARKGENVLIKALFCGSNLKYTQLRGVWERKGLAKIQDTSALTVDLQDIRQNLELTLINLCKEVVITEFCIERPTRTYAAPFKTCMIYSAREHLYEVPELQEFHGVSTLTDAVDTAASLGYPIHPKAQDKCEYVCFGRTHRRVQPLLWLTFHEVNPTSEIVRVRTKAQVVGSYLYILFIDAFGCGDTIDIGTFIAKGRILSFISN